MAGRYWIGNPGCATEPCCASGCNVRVTALGCGPSGAAGNPTVHPAPGAIIQAVQGGVVTGEAVADSLGVALVPITGTGPVTINGTSDHLAGTLITTASCPGPSFVNLLLTPTTGYACLRGVLYRPLQVNLVLTDPQATRTITYGQNLRGTTAVIWDSCQAANTGHLEGGGCVQTFGTARFTWEFGSRFDSLSGLWQPILTQVWKANVCPPPDRYTLLGGGSCPPPNPSGVSDFNSTSSRVADWWIPGPPFMAEFTFPEYAFSSLGSGIDEHWLPMAGTVTVSEVP